MAANRVLRVEVDPQLGETNVFGIVIYSKVLGTSDEEIVAQFSDITGLSGVYGQLATWAETFTATGGQHLWTFINSKETLKFNYE